MALVALGHLLTAWRISHRSIWSHPHFSGATLAQFFYVAGQAGIFSFLINYMVAEVPPLPAAWDSGVIRTKGFIEVNTTLARDDIRNLPALADKLKRTPDAVSAFLRGRLSEETLSALNDYNETASNTRSLQSDLLQDLNTIVKQDPKKAKEGQLLFDSLRFQGVAPGEKTRQLLSQNHRNAEDSAPRTACSCGMPFRECWRTMTACSRSATSSVPTSSPSVSSASLSAGSPGPA